MKNIVHAFGFPSKYGKSATQFPLMHDRTENELDDIMQRAAILEAEGFEGIVSYEYNEEFDKFQYKTYCR